MPGLVTTGASMIPSCSWCRLGLGSFAAQHAFTVIIKLCLGSTKIHQYSVQTEYENESKDSSVQIHSVLFAGLDLEVLDHH
jgi:hypothetical protein